MNLAIFFLFLLTNATWATTPQCLNIFSAQSSLSDLAAPLPQLFLWEETANLYEMQKPTEPVAVPYSLVSRDAVSVTRLQNLEPTILSAFEKGNQITWPQHPLNTDPTTPFFAVPSTGKAFMYFSASRSLFFFLGQDLFSLKMPTNRPHPLGRPQPSKAQLQERAGLSVTRSQMIQDLDHRLAPSAHLQVLYDVAAYLEKSTGNGFVLRDLRPLQDGNYYLPGFSLPFVGGKILDHLKKQGLATESFENFWSLHYAEALGRAKAELLLRYGLVMNAPNAQNILVQLDKNLLPTGKIFFRDIGDSRFFENVAYPLGLEKFIRKDISEGHHSVALLNIATETSFWKMAEAGLDERVIAGWEARHDRAFAQQIAVSLGLPSETFSNLNRLQGFFATDGARQILIQYAQRKFQNF